MASGLLNVSVSGLNAAQMGILTTSHNISNASTPGFNRQVLVQASNTPMFTGAGFIGQGVSIQSIRRVYSDFLSAQVKDAESNASALDTYSTQISQIDNLLADPSAGLSPALQSFFSAVSTASSDPSSVPSRQAMLSAAQALVARFHGIDQQLTDVRSGVNAELTSEVAKISAYVNQISDLNQRISVAQAAGNAQPANDLLDQRDQVISDLNKEIKVSVHQETDGSVSVFFGSGQPLVVGTQTYQLLAVPGHESSDSLQIALKSPRGDVTDLPDSLVTGGALAGLLNFRNEMLDTTQNNLGRIGLALVSTFNAQHMLGQDLNGDPGGNFFDPIKLATAVSPTNVGNATVTANVTMSAYKVVYSTAAGFSITRLSDDTNLGSFNSLPQVVDGIRISLNTGSPVDGDAFLITPDAAAGDRAVGYSTNKGSATLQSTASNIQTLTDSDYRLTMSAKNTFTLTRLSDQTTWTGSGLNQSAALSDLMGKAAPQGFSINIAGTVQVGDSFRIQPTRYVAHDISIAITDAKNIALAAPIRTAAGLSNSGAAIISAGTLTDTSVLQQAPFTIKASVDAAGNTTLSGFPVGSTVMMGATIYKIGDATSVPYATGNPGQNISVNGIGVAISGTPANGDTFVIGPNAPFAANGNAGGATIAAGAVTTTNSVPSGAITLTYHDATIPPALPNRLTGFPVGSVVTVTPLHGQPTSYTISDTSDSVPYTSEAAISFNGIGFTISGNAVEGDTFTITPNAAGVADNRNGGLLGALQTRNVLGGGTSTYQSSYAQLVSQVGSKASEVNVSLTAQQQLVTQGTQAIQSQSGVNLDEEAANLLRYQQAYQAAAKIIDISGKLFDALLALGQ